MSGALSDGGGGARLGSSQHDGRRSGYQGPRVPPNLLRKSVPPTSASRRFRLRSSGPDSRSATRLHVGVLNHGDIKARRQVMEQVQSIGAASEAVMAKLVAGLEIEFGRGAGEALAERFLAAEESDFLWEARSEERWLGAFEDLDGDDDFELDRVAIIGRLDGRWYVAVSIVDGDGMAHGLMGRRIFSSEKPARQAFADAR
jgi:hypothetical protein